MLDKVPRAGTNSKHAEGVKASEKFGKGEFVLKSKKVNRTDKAGISVEIRADQMHATPVILRTARWQSRVWLAKKREGGPGGNQRSWWVWRVSEVVQMFEILTRGACSVGCFRWLFGPRSCKIGSKQKAKDEATNKVCFSFFDWRLALKDREEVNTGR